MLHKIELAVDTLDYQAIQEAMSRRQRWQVLPDTDEVGANLAGRLLAEICRGWLDARDNTEPYDPAEDWKAGWDDE